MILRPWRSLGSSNIVRESVGTDLIILLVKRADNIWYWQHWFEHNWTDGHPNVMGRENNDTDAMAQADLYAVDNGDRLLEPRISVMIRWSRPAALARSVPRS